MLSFFENLESDWSERVCIIFMQCHGSESCFDRNIKIG